MAKHLATDVTGQVIEEDLTFENSNSLKWQTVPSGSREILKLDGANSIQLAPGDVSTEVKITSLVKINSGGNALQITEPITGINYMLAIANPATSGIPSISLGKDTTGSNDTALAIAYNVVGNSASLNIIGDPSNTFVIADGGFIGFGTSTPTASAHISGSLRYVDGTEAAGLFLTTDVSGNASWATPPGAGDVVGPAGATDDAIARYDTATGKLLQDSAVTIDDTGNIGLSATATIDGRDPSVDGTKLDAIEISADVTDAANVNAAGAIVHTDITPSDGWLLKTGSEAYTAIKTNLTGTTNPGTGDDNTAGYAVGSRWINITLDEEFVALDVSTGAAVWKNTTQEDPPTKEFFIHLPAGNSNINNDYAVENITSSSTFNLTFKVPHDFTTLLSGMIVGIPGSTAGPQTVELTSTYAANGEGHTTNTESDLLNTYSYVANQMTEFDISSILTGISGGDYVGVTVNRLVNGFGTLSILGFRLRYS